MMDWTKKRMIGGNQTNQFTWIAGLVIFILGSSSAFAVDIGDEELGINVDFTYATKYMWHGFDVFDDHGAYQPSITFDYQGFFAGVWASYPAASGFEDLSEIDLYLGYERAFFEEEQYALDTSLTYTYFAFPKANSAANLDAQEIAAGLAMPNLISLGPSSLVPSYTMYYLWDGVQGETPEFDGFYHTFGLSYDIPFPALLPEQEEQAISLMWDITYNDGPFATGSDWSYSRVGASTTFEWNGIYFTPGIYYQININDIVNNEDDLYATFSVGYTF